MDAVTLATNLEQFYGTEEYHRWSILYKNFFLTDGAKYLADQAGAYWLMDIIGSYQPGLLGKEEFFQVWRIRVDEDHSARVTCDDGNDNVLVTQEIPYTDFPISEYRVYAIWDGTQLVILLPGEY